MEIAPNMRGLVGIIKKDIGSIRRILENMREQERNSINVLSELSIPDPTLPFIYSLDSLHKALDDFDESPDPKKALRLVTLLLSVTSQPDAVTSRLSVITIAPWTPQNIMAAASSLSTVWNSFVQNIKSVLHSISSTLWSLVSNYLNLKEWSVKGAVGTPAIASLFGITGSVEIQFTFEK